MNTPPLPPQEPLDAQERELARILRALPGGEPPAALDAKILRAATNAAASSRRPGARVLASAGALWGIGSAAAAVLALGVAWQLKYSEPVRAPMEESAPRAQAVSDVDEDDAAVQVEFRDRASVPLPDMPPPPAKMPAQPAATAAPALESPRRRQEQAAAPASPPPPPPEAFAMDQLDEHVAREAATNATGAAEAEAKADAQGQLSKERDSSEGTRATAAKSAAQAAPVQSAPAPAAAAQETRSDLGSVAVMGGQAGPGDAAPIKPATWLAEVRKLRDEGKIAEARARLVEFRRAYPKWVIPTDLAPLLTE